MIRVLILLILLLSSSVYAESNHHPILVSIRPHSVSIIGETHKRPESFRFFQAIINDYLQNHKCLIVALEIASNQQNTIDQVIKGSAKVSDIEVAPPIDHPDFRLMIESLANLQRNNDCFKLIAVDADIKLKNAPIQISQAHKKPLRAAVPVMEERPTERV